MRLQLARSAAMMAGALFLVTTVDANAQGRCASRVAARLVCDSDGCVRPISDIDCSVADTMVVAPGRVRGRLALPPRVARDEIALLLAKLN